MTRRRKPVRMCELIAECHSRFSHFEEDDFANWLESGFRVYHCRLEGTQIGPDQPFGFVSGFIGFGDSLLDDLTLIFLNLVPEDQKPPFRKSIAKLLMKVVSRDDFPLEAVRELIYLIERVGASESLSSLATVVQTGRYGAPYEWLQVDAIRVLKQMLGSEKAVDGLYEIAALGAFKVELSFDVLEALCRYVPNNWPLHVMALSDKTGQWFQKAEIAAGDVLEGFITCERQFIEAFEKEVTLPRITRMMHDFLDRRPSLTTAAKRWVDDHFVKALDKSSGVVQSVIAEQIHSKSGFGITPQINSVLPKLRPPVHDEFERDSPSAII